MKATPCGWQNNDKIKRNREMNRTMFKLELNKSKFDMTQAILFPEVISPKINDKTSTTFASNMKLPVHRWFRFSAGFSADWVENVIRANRKSNAFSVLDPFAGSGTTLIVSEKAEVKSFGIEAHPFIARIAKAKLFYRTDPIKYKRFASKVKDYALSLETEVDNYPPLIQKCFQPNSLKLLDKIRKAWEHYSDGSPESELTWLTLVSIIRTTSHAGTAPWQYVLPNKTKKFTANPLDAYESMVKLMCQDMNMFSSLHVPRSQLFSSDARTCIEIPSCSIDLVITSPPYANNYDYADATRLEMSFMKEIAGWGDLQENIRKYLIRSCSQHVPPSSMNLADVLSDPFLEPIRDEISSVCKKLEEIRHSRGGKKSYHLMIACYFLDMAKVWYALRRVCKQSATVCFVIGDSAPYGIYVPVAQWMGELAKSSGFKFYNFEKIRDRNIKWKNRKHRVPLCEGRLWVRGE